MRKIKKILVFVLCVSILFGSGKGVRAAQAEDGQDRDMEDILRSLEDSTENSEEQDESGKDPEDQTDPEGSEDQNQDDESNEQDDSEDQDSDSDEQEEPEDPEDQELTEYIREAREALEAVAQKETLMALVYLCDRYPVREAPDTEGKEAVKLPSGTTVFVKSMAVDEEFNIWFQISAEYNGVVYNGYIEKIYLAYSNEYLKEWENLYLPQTAMFATLASSYADVEQFPASYQDKLMRLKQAHPNWIFVRQNTNLDWKTVVSKEDYKDRNLISSSMGAAYRGDYHSPNWHYASNAAVQYYLDPRNFLDETRVFQFEQLTYNPSYHTGAAVQNILNNTFMKGTLPGAGMTYAEAFFQIGVSLKVSPFHLACRVYQEQGKGTSALISGTYDVVPEYKGYYNYFNIGASGTTTKQVVESGLARARKEGWNTPYAALKGGAGILSKGYILRGQDTLYLQKFDVDASDGTLYTHQYMQNIMAPYSESYMVKNAYSKTGALENSFVFKIPVYNNMPATACPAPGQTAIVTPTPETTPTATPKVTATPTATPKVTATPKATPTATPTPRTTPAATPKATPTVTSKATPTPRATPAPTPRATATPRVTPAVTPKATATPGAATAPEPSATPGPTSKATARPTAIPKATPKATARPDEAAASTPKITARPDATAASTPKITARPDATAASTPKATPAGTATPKATPSETSTPRATLSPAPAETSTPKVTSSPAPAESSTPKVTSSPTETATPKVTPVPSPSETAVPKGTEAPKVTAPPTATAAPPKKPSRTPVQNTQNTSSGESGSSNEADRGGGDAGGTTAGNTTPAPVQASPAAETETGSENERTVSVTENANSAGVRVAAATPKPITESEEKDAVVMDVSKTGMVYSQTLQQIHEQQMKVVLKIDEGITWTIDGSSMEEGDYEDLNLKVTLGSSQIPGDRLAILAGEESYVEMTLEHEGAFGFSALLSVELDGAWAGRYANLFYYNEEDGDFEFMCATEIGNTGSAAFAFKHASDYVIIISDETKEMLLSEKAGQLQAAKEQALAAMAQAKEELPAEEPSRAAGIIAVILLASIAVGLGSYLIFRRKD